MIIQKLRLQHGWSQQQLAEMSGLSTRTIQRIENGNKASTESVKSLAAVFEVDFQTLNEALLMSKEHPTSNNIPQAHNEILPSHALHMSEAEKQAFKHVRKLKRFYKDIVKYIIVITLLAAINWITSPEYWWVVWVILGWGASFIIRAVYLFVPLSFFGADWEKRQIEKQLNRKL